MEYTGDILTNLNNDRSIRFVRALRLVVVSGGAFGSPTILERSGIGAKSVLDRCGVQQIVNLPGVGENYQGQRTGRTIDVRC